MAIELNEELARNSDLRYRRRLLERISGIPAGIGAAQAPEPGEQLVGACDRRDVEMALAGDASDRELRTPIPALHPFLPVQPEHTLGGGGNPLPPKPALERLRPQAEVFLADQALTRVSRFLWAHGSRAQIQGRHSIPFVLHEFLKNRRSEGLCY